VCDNQQVVTCSGDAQIRVFNLTRFRPLESDAASARVTCPPLHVFRDHDDRVKKLATKPADPNLIYSTSEDGSVRRFDLRDPRHSTVLLRSVQHPPISIDIHPTRTAEFALGGYSSSLQLFDERCICTNDGGEPISMLEFSAPRERVEPPDHITSVCYK
jgi:WD40 repeat protein